MEIIYRVNKIMYIVFINLEKVLDGVNWKKSFDILKDININTTDIRIVKETDKRPVF